MSTPAPQNKPTPQPRARNAAATSEAILDAARVVFTQRGYDGAGTREIAELAEVNVALINRYFGSKEGLFAAAIPPIISVDALLEGDMKTFGARAAAMFTHKPHLKEADPMIAILRSAASAEAVPTLRKALDAQILAPLAAQLSGENTLERAALIMAQLSGFDLATRVMGLTTTNDPEKKQLEARLALSIQMLVDQ